MEPADSGVLCHHRLPLANAGNNHIPGDSGLFDSKGAPLVSASSSVNGKNAAGQGLSGQVGKRRVWKAHHALAGEWRDRLGRLRRAHNTESCTAAAPPAAAATSASVGTFGGCSSCEGTEISFEGLINELRERLPRASRLMTLVAREKTACDSVSTTDPVVDGARMNEAERQGKAERTDTTKNRSRGKVGERDTSRVPTMPGSAESRQAGMDEGDTPQRDRTARDAFSPQGESLPPGCLPLRRSPEATRIPARQVALSIGYGRDRYTPAAALSPPAMRHRGNPFLSPGVHTPGAVAAPTALENCSPSAAMVAAAKAQERSLPLLQVCAVSVGGLARA